MLKTKFAEFIEGEKINCSDKQRSYFIQLVAFEIASIHIKNSGNYRKELWETLVEHGCPPASGEMEDTIQHLCDEIEDARYKIVNDLEDMKEAPNEV